MIRGLKIIRERSTPLFSASVFKSQTWGGGEPRRGDFGAQRGDSPGGKETLGVALLKRLLNGA
jgi:hypothetical protein